MNRTNPVTGSWVMRLIVINALVYMFQRLSGDNSITYYFGLIPLFVVEKGFVWQICSYMFLHGGFFHLFLNMYALLIFGGPIEQTWGSKKFLIYYFFTGIGAGITILIMNLVIGGNAALIPTIGASGAVFGLLLAFGMLFPDAQLLIFFVLPMKAKHLVVLYGALELYSMWETAGNSSISHIGHLGGLLFGLIFFGILRKRGIEFKTKKFKAKVIRKVERPGGEIFTAKTDNKILLREILTRVKASGFETLTDDEYQFVKLMTIMYDEEYSRKGAVSEEARILKELEQYF